MAVHRGRVSHYVADRGFGFIVPEDGGKDVFVHINQVADENVDVLAPGTEVVYELEMDERRGQERAVNVRAAA